MDLAGLSLKTVSFLATQTEMRCSTFSQIQIWPNWFLSAASNVHSGNLKGRIDASSGRTKLNVYFDLNLFSKNFLTQNDLEFYFFIE